MIALLQRVSEARVDIAGQTVGAIDQGLLVRPVSEEVVHRESLHYLTFSEDKEDDEACCRLRDWLMQQV